MSSSKKLLHRKIIFCPKCCRSMFVGINTSYVSHLLKHTSIHRILLLAAVPCVISIYPASISVMSAKKGAAKKYVTEDYSQEEKVVSLLLKRFSRIKKDQVDEITKIILRNAREKNLDPKLVASIIVVESRGNPLAVSHAKAVGIMQIHVPTWGNIVGFTERNPFDPEVNIDVGTTILADYLKRYRALKTALAAYEGSLGVEGGSYPAKVLAIYNSRVR